MPRPAGSSPTSRRRSRARRRSSAASPTDALAPRIPHTEAAGLLAEAIGDVPLLLVLDELERLAESREAWAVIEALSCGTRRASVRVVLISRRGLPIALAVARGDTSVAVARRGAAGVHPARGGRRRWPRWAHAKVDASAVVEATGGWVTGVLFEAWRSRRRTSPAPAARPTRCTATWPRTSSASSHPRPIVTSSVDDVAARRGERGAGGGARAGRRRRAARRRCGPPTCRSTGSRAGAHALPLALSRIPARAARAARRDGGRSAAAGPRAATRRERATTRRPSRSSCAAAAPEEALAPAERAIFGGDRPARLRRRRALARRRSPTSGPDGASALRPPS